MEAATAKARLPLLAPGRQDAWRLVAREERQNSVVSGNLEEQLRRGQKLSAQAAALRRALRPGARGS